MGARPEGERPQAKIPRVGEVSEARGPNLYIGDGSFNAWFPSGEPQSDTRVTWWMEVGHTQGCVSWPWLSLGFTRQPEKALIEALKQFPEHLPVA